MRFIGPICAAIYALAYPRYTATEAILVCNEDGIIIRNWLGRKATRAIANVPANEAESGSDVCVQAHVPGDIAKFTAQRIG